MLTSPWRIREPIQWAPAAHREHSRQREDVELLHYLRAFFVVVFMRDKLLLP